MIDLEPARRCPGMELRVWILVAVIGLGAGCRNKLSGSVEINGETFEVDTGSAASS